MTIVSITMQIIPEKRQELLQTLDELAEAKHKEKGFRGAQAYLEMGHSGHLRLNEEWETLEDVERYQHSEYFQILRGALRVLTTAAEIEIIPGDRLPVRQIVDELRNKRSII